MGERLAEARDLFKYDRRVGGFEGWAKSRIRMFDRQAHRLISVYERLGLRRDELFSLSREALLDVVAMPESQREAVIETLAKMVVDGETVPDADIWTFRYHPKAEWN